MDLAAPRTPAERFAGIIAWLNRDVAAWAAKNRAAAPLILLLWGRLNRLALRMTALAARVAAGTAAPRRRTVPRPASARPRKPDPRLPRRFAWLVRLVPGTGAFGSQLQYLLADPEMTALIAAAPQAGRILRPLCRMLGVRPPPNLLRPRPAPPAAPPRPAASGRAPPPPSPSARSPSAPLPRPPAQPSVPASAPDPRACGPPIPP